MKQKTIDEQLQQFFNHNPIDDPLYLKKYVRAHPDNKMAWYLLGKEYATLGKEAKANYCFGQAGEVFEAFEKKNFPALEELLQEREQTRPKPDTKPFVLLKRTLIAMLLFFVLSSLQVDAPKVPNVDDAFVWGSGAETTPEPPEPAMPDQPQPLSTSPSPRMKAVYLTFGADRNEKTKTALQTMLLDGKNVKADYSYLLELQSEGSWGLWTKPATAIVSTERAQNGTGRFVRYYSKAMCDCETDDPTIAIKTFGRWSTLQEQRLTLRTAIGNYAKLNGNWPKSIQDLTGNYPDNVIPGFTTYMKVAFPELLGAVQAAAKPQPSLVAVPVDRPDAKQPADPQKAAEEAVLTDLTQPYEIIVDKQNHRLALVSGHIIIRNYVVGLGGNKTPEGQFVISEKVRNPNGRSDGAFGSRGMTLSDTLYAIHGTDEQDSIGKDESLGCIRMSKSDVEELFDMAPKGTKVTITRGVLPGDTVVSPPGKSPFKIKPVKDETNPNKVYKWLD